MESVRDIATVPVELPVAATDTGGGVLIEQNIANWDELFSRRPRWSRYPPEELSGFIAKTFPDREQRRALKALEVGCGPGANLWFLAREGFRIAGIDGSAVAIESTRERLLVEGMSEQLLQADLKVGNFALLPWNDSSFDAVIDIQAISHNTAPVIQSVIAEIRRVLKPGGWFFARMFGEKTTGIMTRAIGLKREPQDARSLVHWPDAASCTRSLRRKSPHFCLRSRRLLSIGCTEGLANRSMFLNGSFKQKNDTGHGIPAR